MEISSFNWETVWQVACGDTTRDYRNLFFTFGLLSIACTDDEGPYDETKRPYDSKEWKSALRDIYPIAAEMEIGDTVIAKKGKAIVGVGTITSDYCYDGFKDWKERFSEELEKSTILEPYVDIHFSKTRLDDVEGWYQMHTRNVDRYVGPEIKCKSLAITTVARARDPSTIKMAKRFLKNAKKQKTRPLSPPADVLTNKDLIYSLIAEGMSSRNSEELSNRLVTLQRLAEWYYLESGNVSEHEARAYLVWPLLQALGWSEQCVKFEWRARELKILDLALMKTPYSEDNEDQIPIIIGETKKLHYGLHLAYQQAEKYAIDNNVKSILITDGIRYHLHKNLGKKNYKEMYMNILKLRNAHPYDNKILGADDLLINLLR